jgi:hypothetical protein
MVDKVDKVNDDNKEYSSSRWLLVTVVLSVLVAIILGLVQSSNQINHDMHEIKLKHSGGQRGGGRGRHAATSFAAAADLVGTRYSSPPPPPLTRSMQAKSMNVNSMKAKPIKAMPTSFDSPKYTPGDDDDHVPRMLVYRANINIQCDRRDLQRLSDTTKEFVTSHGGYVQSANSAVGWMDQQRGVMAGAIIQIQLRVPTALYQTTMTKLRTLAAGEQDVLSESESIDDVTEQFVDQSSRAAALSATHEQLLKLLASAKSTKDVLAVQRELRNVVQELESRKSRVKSLQNKADYSHISLALQQRPLKNIERPLVNLWASWKPSDSIERAIRMLIFLAIWIADTSIMALAIVVPSSIVVFIGRQCFFSCRKSSLDDIGMH